MMDEPQRRTLLRSRSLSALIFCCIAALTLLNACNRSPRNDPAMIDLAARATVHALPTPLPRIVEVTRVIEVTRLVEVTRIVEVTSVTTSTATATPTSTPTATPEPAAQIDVVVASVVDTETQPVAERSLANTAAACPTTSGRAYELIPVAGGGAEHPDYAHADLNLALRGFEPTNAALALIEMNGPTDSDPPQLAGLFTDGRMPTFVATYRVRDWNWSCGERGCQSTPLDNREVTLLGMSVQPGETISIPARNAQIYGGGFKVLVLYADKNGVTLGYTREDSVANGYTVHIENICVDPNLLAIYRTANDRGRGSLPGIRTGEVIGAASGTEVAVATRDRGAFLDPRTRKNWWQ